MKISYSEYIKKTDVSVLIAEAIFSELQQKTTIKTIADIADTSSGGTPLRSIYEYYGGDIPWLKSGELNDGVIEKAEEFITEKGLANSSAKLLPENTLLLAMYGATAGRTGITKIKASTNQAICALFPKDDVSQEYLFWFLRQHRHKFIEISKGGAQPNISQTVINSTPIPIPDKKLQKQITDVLQKIEKEGILDVSIIPTAFQAKVKSVFTTKNNVFEISTELTHQLSLVKKLRQQLLQDAVQGKLVEQNKKDELASELLRKIKDEKQKLIAEKKLKKEKELPPIKPEEIPFKIPENWVWCRMSEICNFITDGDHQAPPQVAEGVPFIVISNIKNNQLRFEETRFVLESYYNNLPKEKKPRNGDILYTVTGSFGIPVILEDVPNFCVQRHIGIIKPNRFISNKWLYFLLKAPFLYKQASDVAWGIAQRTIPLQGIRNFLIPLPPLSEQNRIVQKLDELMLYCNDLEESIKQSESQNEKLLQQVLREALRKEPVEEKVLL